ncbi:hypothetical protein CDD83_7561 [Cordyceps sp. RAO-2017]|nr:hypothetical protein CDD83_7561 [Cordyceps sp. RAO-2017]
MSLKSTASRISLANSLGLLAGYSTYWHRSSHCIREESSSSTVMTFAHSFQTLFAVPLSCDGCVKATN